MALLQWLCNGYLDAKAARAMIESNLETAAELARVRYHVDFKEKKERNEEMRRRITEKREKKMLTVGGCGGGGFLVMERVGVGWVLNRNQRVN